LRRHEVLCRPGKWEREQLRRRLGWLYNGAGSSVLIAGLFHSMHNAIVNSTGPVAVVDLPQFEVWSWTGLLW
jgi:hypothetical protein